ncbi:MAG TPA: YcxB family protein [Chitinophaga sp.]
MHLEFSYKKNEVLNALRYHFLHRGEVKVFQITLLIFILFTITGYWFHVVNRNALAGVTGMTLLIAWSFWYLLPISTYNKAATFQDNIRLRVNEEGMTITTGQGGDRSLGWQRFSQVVETPKFIYLYRDKKSFFLIPLSAFQTAEARTDFMQLLQRRFPGKYVIGKK